ncbi:MAG: hypothetical protein LC624_11300 [Halobacteriales archaeon]|nr:hypothetical protein [Halobacteriales archaeon]
MAPLPALLSGLTALLSVAFAGLVLSRWRRARAAHQLAWGIALACFALASLLEVEGALLGWGALAYKAYFVLTAVMVGCMAAGTALLLAPGLGRGFAAYVAVLAQALLVLAFLAPSDAARLALAAEQGEVPTRILSGVGILHALVDIPAALLLVGGAVVGWRRTGRAGTLLIGAGALVFTGVHSAASGAQSGLLALDSATLFEAGSLLGLVLMFGGYLASRASPPPLAEVPLAA